MREMYCLYDSKNTAPRMIIRTRVKFDIKGFKIFYYIILKLRNRAMTGYIVHTNRIFE